MAVGLSGHVPSLRAQVIHILAVNGLISAPSQLVPEQRNSLYRTARQVCSLVGSHMRNRSVFQRNGTEDF